MWENLVAQGLDFINKIIPPQSNSGDSCPPCICHESVCPTCPLTYQYLFYGLLASVVTVILVKFILRLYKTIYKGEKK